MRRRTRLLLLAAAAGLIVPTAITSSPASAVEQDLTLSAVAGPAGSEFTASSASCVADESEDTIQYLYSRLISGTGPDAVLAGTGFSIGSDVGAIVIPDWVDPAQPAVVEAQCIQLVFGSEEVPTQTTFDYDPVAFDVEDPLSAPVQERTYSRTSLQAGQAFAVDASGCFLEDADFAYVDVARGADLTFGSATDYATSGGEPMDADSFSVPTALSDGGLQISVRQTGNEDPVVESLVEVPTDFPAGTYSTISYCTNEDGSTLMFEPQFIEVTGDAPFADIDLTVPAESRTATLAGGTCTTGDVSAQMIATDFDDLFEEAPDGTRADTDAAIRSGHAAGASAALRSTGGRGLTRSNDAWAGTRGGGTSDRALSGDGYFEAVVAPAADGSWSASDTVSFDDGIVEGYAWCGDPLAEGFLYDPRAAVVDIAEVVPPTTPPTTIPAPVPANAVQGTPTYAG